MWPFSPVFQETSKVSASKSITSQRTQITKLTQQNISSVSACMQFLISFLVLGPALQLSEHQEPRLSRDPCLSRGQEKAESPSRTPVQRPNLHTCSSLCLQHLSLPSLPGKLLLILQVSDDTSPPPGSPPCPRTDSQSTAPLLCCGVLVHLSNHLHHGPTNAARPGTLPSLFTIIISPVT